ncbi:MAG: GAF domain-containing protein [Anaerolineae bacterium]|nr:GAF domain-containing protein [Anaerolineae bacterium]
MVSGSPGQRPRIGFLMDALTSGYQMPIWRGLRARARERDVDTVAFVGGILEGMEGTGDERNTVYDLVSTACVDGLVVLAGSIGTVVSIDRVRAFLERFRPLPLASIALPLPRIPSVVLDNYASTRALVAHLVDVHGFHRLAFYRKTEGHPEADDRFRAYRDVLQERGLGYDPNLVIPGEYYQRWESGVQLLLDERGLKPGRDFEALVAVDDYAAFWVLHAFLDRGIQVPDDVAMVGFDDAEESRLAITPLTTAHQPLFEQGRHALDLVLAQLEGEETVEQLQLRAELVVRRSCGCPERTLRESAVVAGGGTVRRLETDGAALAALAECRADVQATIVERFSGAASEVGAGFSTAVAQVLDAFIQAGAATDFEALFLDTLDRILRAAVAQGNRDQIACWQDVLSLLRAEAVAGVSTRALPLRIENLLHQARVLAAMAEQRVASQRLFQAAQRDEALRTLGQHWAAAANIDQLLALASAQLPDLGFSSGFVSLYASPDLLLAWLRLAFDVQRGGALPLVENGEAYIAESLLPAGVWPVERRSDLAVQPLFFRDVQLGFVILEIGPEEGQIFEIVRSQLSSAIQTVAFRTQLENRAVQLRTAAEVSRAASSVLDPDSLVQQAVDLVRERFGLYYVGLFLVDETGEWAVLRAATGDVGKQMLDQGYRLEIGSGSMTGWCIFNREARIADDVALDEFHRAHPLLPKTRSEMALPLISRGEVIGALTVQSDQRGLFGHADIAVLQTMADQLANAITNARLYAQAQAEISERRRVQAALTQEQVLMRSFMNHTTDHVYFKDRDSRFIRVSASTAQHWGWESAADAIGKTDFDVFTAEHARPAFEDEQQIIRTGKPLIGVEERETWEDRPDTWVSTSKLPLIAENGEIIGTFGISRDITLLKYAQLDLEKRNTQLQTVAEVSRATTGILDVATLASTAVDLIQKRLDLYYVGLFLLEGAVEGEPVSTTARERWAVLQAGTGEAGKRMVEQGHRLLVGGDSMIGRSIAARQAGIALDVGAEAVRFENPLLTDTRSELALPLVSGGEAIGALTIQSDREAAFEEADIQILQTMADQLANAIENTWLLARTQETLRRTVALYRVSQTLAELESRESALQVLVDSVVDVLNVDRVILATFDMEHQRIEDFVRGGPSQELIPDLTYEELQAGLTGWVLREQQPALLLKGKPDPREPLAIQQRREETDAGSILVAPLRYRDEAFGTLTLINRPQQRDFDQSDVEVLTALASQAAAALANVRLLEQTQMALRDLQAVQRRYQEQAWAHYLSVARSVGHEVTDLQAGILGDAVLPEVQHAVAQQRPVVLGEPGAERSALVAPSTSRGHTLGAVGVHAEPDHAWTEDEIALVEAVAERLALAAENLRLLDETQRSAARERLVGDIATQMRQSLSVDTVLQTVARELGSLPGVQEAAVHIDFPEFQEASESSGEQVPTTGSGQVPATGSGQVPAAGSGQVPATGSGQVPTTGSGQVPTTGSGQA